MEAPTALLDRCLQEIVVGLRNPDTLRHVLCIIRCWCAEMVKLKAAIRRVKRIPDTAGVGRSRLYCQSELRHPAETQTARFQTYRVTGLRPLCLRREP